MNIQDYISSGIVEMVVLGLAGQKEREEFEELCTRYPELVAARDAFEAKLEDIYMQHSSTIVLPVGLRQSLMEATLTTSHNQTKPTNVITMENANRPVRRTNWLAVASVILLIVAAYFAYQFHSQNESLKQANVELQKRADSTDAILQQIIAEQKVFKDSNVTVVSMEGTKIAPRSSANVYWDSINSSVYLVVKNMPKLPTDQQYQLWALIDGKPKDLGVFDADQDKVILKMTDTKKAEAFAITIEKKGGNPSPTLEKMQSLGKTKAPL
ncbi:anti-sigma factor [Pseudobacter ginsenosidimutans]|nr:anti-sigma factor [Pseudobacter ginsenosidimutans]QEC41832.1 anti-sigma factor [Pseudobacter ginsenosidimutans]